MHIVHIPAGRTVYRVAPRASQQTVYTIPALTWIHLDRPARDALGEAEVAIPFRLIEPISLAVGTQDEILALADASGATAHTPESVWVFAARKASRDGIDGVTLVQKAGTRQAFTLDIGRKVKRARKPVRRRTAPHPAPPAP